MILVSRRFLKFFTSNFATAITLWPFVIIKFSHLRHDEILINHERIHLRQQLELLIIPFYVWYIIEYLVYRFKGMNKTTAYRNISFEQEAYCNEKNLDYLNIRKFFAFITYLKVQKK